MCYDDNARPPIPPGEAGQAHGEDIVLTASDANRFAAYVAHPAHSTDAQIIIYPDIRGLHQFYKELALRFAEIGVMALTIDYFGRTAGVGSRDDSFEFMPHVQQLKLSNFYTDVQAALDYLRSHGGGQHSTFAIGFCLGGTFSLFSATQDFKFAGVIPFYANLSRNFDGDKNALEVAREIKYPVLGSFGGADQSIPVEQVRQLDQKLTEAGIDHDIRIYPDAPHSFFDRRAVDYADASKDAWHRIRHFVQDHTANPVTHS